MSTGPRTAAFYCIYDDDEWLALSLQSIYPAVDAVYFMVSSTPWRGPVTDNSKTLQIIETFPDPDGKIQLVRGDWNDEVAQRNAALAQLTIAGFTYALIIDADEIYDTDSLRALLEHANKHSEVGCWHCWFTVYWKSHRHIIAPPEEHQPPVLLKLGFYGAVIEDSEKGVRH